MLHDLFASWREAQSLGGILKKKAKCPNDGIGCREIELLAWLHCPQPGTGDSVTLSQLSQLCPLPEPPSARQMLPALCSAEGTGPGTAELPHSSAAALPAQEGLHALDPGP